MLTPHGHVKRKITKNYAVFHQVTKPVVTTLLGNRKQPVLLGNSNTCAKPKLGLFLLIQVLEILCRET